MSLNKGMGEPGAVIKRRREKKIVARETPLEVSDHLIDRAKKRAEIIEEQNQMGERVAQLRRPLATPAAATKPKRQPRVDETSDNIPVLVDESDLQPLARRR